MVAELPTAQSQLYTPVAFFAAVYKQAKETRDCLQDISKITTTAQKVFKNHATFVFTEEM